MSLAGVAPIVNRSGEVIPPRAAMAFDGTVDGEGRLGVVKPNADDSTVVLFNGPVSVPVGGAGQGYHCYPRAVASLELADLPLPADGVPLGTKAGQWRLRTGRRGFRAVTPVYAGDVTVIPDGAAFGSGGTGGGIYARITGNAGKRYAFTQVAVRAENPPGTVTDDAIDVPGGVVGTTTVGWAYDIGGGSAALHTPAPALVVLMTPNPLVAGTWLFGPVTVCP